MYEYWAFSYTKFKFNSAIYLNLDASLAKPNT